MRGTNRNPSSHFLSLSNFSRWLGLRFINKKPLTKPAICSKNNHNSAQTADRSNQTYINIMKMFPKVIAATFGVVAAYSLSAQVIVDPNYSGPYTANPITVAGVNAGWAPFSAGLIAASPTYNGAPTSLGLALGAQDGWATPGAYQIISGIIPGNKYTVSAWVYQTAAATTAGGLLQLGYLTSALGGPNTVENPGNNVGITINGVLGAWTQYSVSATAPAGYTDAVVYTMAQDYNNPAPLAFYFDGVSITQVPEPATIALLGMGLALPLCLIRRRK
jgi:hypothetical protein